ALRDYLRKHSDAATAYGELKKALALQFPDDIDSYCAAKSDFLSGLLAAAGLEAAQVSSINRLNRNFGKA
ncbi:MAG: GrpB family protein, partial [Victivallaceae bacterium]